LLQFPFMKYAILTILVLSLAVGCKDDAKEENTTPAAVPEPAVLTYNVLNVYPHNTSYFTEGLEWRDNALYESTGDPDEKGVSKLVKVDITSGKELQQYSFGEGYFGEGITILNDKIFMLTWKEKKCFVFDLKTFKKTGEFTYEGEGWGMTNDGKYLIMNNGGSNLYYRDPANFQVVKTVAVVDNNGPLSSINELEYVDGFIYSNVWMTNYIVKIDPASGRVLSKADFSYVLNKYAPGAVSDEEQRTLAVLNGIAYDPVGKRFFVTGKYWPKLFEVRFN
jgi:glutamine cyclotransferase